ncbi:MAG: tetratricopeptide repeat protein [Gammaproteobacteria bacterium]|nr:tetratricopeptide repeat protein [Gammaproteobacteria bacterium]MDE0251788.1 tetratricopeptide repeat protein [Gammaproteobacteria bacterium]MDE0403203.1 tetratricopeptide repeat protein [Gammaproteobacteria bacterium]
MVDIFDDEDRAEQLKKLWKEWGIPIIVAILVGLAGFVGWRLFQEHQENKVQEAAELFYQYELAVETEDSEQADSLAVEFLRKYPSSGYSVYLLMLRAKESVEAEDFDAALGYLDSALASTNDKTLKELISIRMARIYLQLDRQDEALSILPKTKSGYAAIVLEITGDIHRQREEFAKAKQFYDEAYEEAYTSSHKERIKLKIALMPKLSDNTSLDPSS